MKSINEISIIKERINKYLHSNNNADINPIHIITDRKSHIIKIGSDYE